MAQPRVLAVLGQPIEHSLSPLMHNTAIQALGLAYVYVAFEVAPADLAEAVAGLRALGVRGYNLTIPHKERVLPYLQELTEEARLIGAVNTVRLDGQRLIGHNTDGVGLLAALRRDGGIDPAGKRCVVLGAGGAARAVVVQLALAGAAEILIANRTPERAAALASHVAANVGGVALAALPLDGERLRQPLARADLVINATSVGMGDDAASPLPADVLSDRHFVCDLIYRPPQTRLLRQARQRGARVLNGLGMLLYQGAAAFQWWTGEPFPVEQVRRALLEHLAAGDEEARS
ncbi:MAG: shikimate dehydrogenase [Candidatus Tectomicrobia bacterium]|nr:shikimate dehydrogenase [Candidatus Tectomicrobia bacterium]